MTSIAASLRRGGWALADQIASSLSNFAVGVIILRSTGIEEYGAYAAAFTVYVFALNLVRSLSSEPLVIRHTDEDPETARVSARGTTGLALAAGIVAGALIAMTASLLGGPLQPALFVVAVALPALLVQDAWRFVFIARGRPQQALINDLVWALAQALLFVVVFWRLDGTLTQLMSAWALGAVAAAFFGSRQAQCWPAPIRVTGWLRQHRDLGPRFAVEFLISGGSGQVAIMSVGVVAGLPALGAIHAAYMLLGPFRVIYLGVTAFALPEAVRARRVSSERFNALVRWTAVGLAVSPILWTAALLVTPESVLTAALGSNWLEARPVLIPMALYMAGTGASQAARVGLRAAQAAQASLRAQIVTAPPLVVLVIAGASFGGAPGAAIGLTIASAFGAAIWWRSHRSAAATFARDQYSASYREPDTEESRWT